MMIREQTGRTIRFPGRVALQQRVLPAYRAAFFDALAVACEDGLSVFAGQPRSEEAIQTTDNLYNAKFTRARNWHFGRVSSPLYLCWQGGLLRWLQEWQPDILIAEANPRNFSTRFGASWMRALGRPVLGWGLGAPQIRKPAPGGGGRLDAVRQPGRQRFMSMFDAMIAYSQRGAQEYRALGFPPERVFIAPNAVAPRPTNPPPERPAEFREHPKIVFVGRLQARKRLDILLRACATLPPALKPRLWIIGDGPARAELQRLAEEIYPQTEFLGALHGSKLESYFRQADLFVLPGTGGLAVQEAMSHGLPVIVAEGDGTQEDLIRPGNGWLVPPGDTAALANTIHQALSDAGRLRQMGLESYRIVREEINIEKMVAVFVEAMLAVTGGN